MRRFVASSVMASWPQLLLVGFLRPAVIHSCNKRPLPRLLLRKYRVNSNKAFKGIPAANRSTKKKVLCEEEDYSHITWWKEKLQQCKKPSTVRLIRKLNYSNLLGLDVNMKNGSLKEGTLNMELLQFKSRFPREVLLCRVGDFYEAIGFDACVLVEYAGLNPFGGLRSDSIPRAGCPVMNLRQTLDDLTRNGFSVCIVEEVQGPTQARCRKGRFISGHAHPGNPYVFGLAGVDHDVDFPDPMPVVGISRSAKGYCMVSVLETMKTYSEEDGLTEEAIIIKLRTCRYHHLYLHTSLRRNSSGTCRWGEFGEGGLLWGECNGKPFEWFDGNPTEDILSKVREIYGLDQKTTFRNVTVHSSKRPQPLCLGTATQIGILPTEGIPSLLQVLLPVDCVGLPALYIRDLLLNPPGFEIASCIQKACRSMSSVKCSFPDFTCVSAAKLVKLLELKEANHIELHRIKNVVDEIIHMSRSPELSDILHTLLQPTWLATGLKIEYDILVNECNSISEKIGDTLFLRGESGQEISSFELIPSEFFEDMESPWKGRVKRNHAEESFAEVERAAEALSVVVREDFFPIVSRVKSLMSPLGGPKGEICYAREHEAVWFRGKRFVPAIWANTAGEEQIKQLKPSIDSKGRKVGEEWFTTSKVEEALNRYHEASDNARAKVLDLLRGLSSELQTKMNILVFSSMLIVIAKALLGHVSEGLRRAWVFPKIYEFEPQDKLLPEANNKMELSGLTPYWFDVAHGKVTKNTVIMNSLFLLTGPNGGGKSSLLRSICAAALLGICGLMVPAKSASVPNFDAIMLHIKAYDSPADGKSSFQIEMSELRSIVNRFTARSLVLVDEICRGTETAKGTCIAGSIVESLDEIGCLGIVSTHLHGIFDLPLVTRNVVNKQMATEVLDGSIRPTWELIDGICRESLAFETAKREGIPEKIIKRAQELYLSINETEAAVATGADISNSKPCLNGVAKVCESKASLGCSSTVSDQQLVEEVKSAVAIICNRKLLDFYKKESLSELTEVRCYFIGAREQPPASTIGTSSTYVLIRPDGTLYVGQTDDLVGRLRAHRSKAGMEGASLIYAIVPGMSVARQLETLLINQLPYNGFKLVNKADGRHRNFGIAALGTEAFSMYQQNKSS